MIEEKRNYIRIYDRILLRLRPLDRQTFERKLESFCQGKEHPWIDPIHSPGEVAKMESYIKRLREENRELAGVLELLNQKLDRILINLIGKEFLRDFQEIEANISAGGLRAIIPEKPEIGDVYEIDLGLLPDWIFMKTFGEVVRIEEIEEGKCEVAFKFIWITEADQDRLVRHIFRQQVLQIKAMKRVRRS